MIKQNQRRVPDRLKFICIELCCWVGRDELDCIGLIDILREVGHDFRIYIYGWRWEVLDVGCCGICENFLVGMLIMLSPD